jgi:hypothetical protein
MLYYKLMGFWKFKVNVGRLMEVSRKTPGINQGVVRSVGFV